MTLTAVSSRLLRGVWLRYVGAVTGHVAALAVPGCTEPDLRLGRRPDARRSLDLLGLSVERRF